MPDLSLIVTAHKEGLLLTASLRSAMATVRFYESQYSGKDAEVILCLDNCDELTRKIAHQFSEGPLEIIETSTGDPGQARNAGVSRASSKYIGFIDGDDLVSENWLHRAYSLCEEDERYIAHSQLNIVFGQKNLVWWHADSESVLCQSTYDSWSNYWDAMCFCRSKILHQHPFRANDMSRGFGHEDWHWSVITANAGLLHKPALGTIHFKRRREGSVSAKVNAKLGTIWPV